MIQHPKPKKPKKAKQPLTCTRCHKGLYKEFGSGPYPEWDWAQCRICKGSMVISCQDQDAMNEAQYRRDLADWERRMAAHKILKTIKITKEQLEALFAYGKNKFAEDYLGDKEQHE